VSAAPLDPIALLERAVATPSPSGEEGPVAAVLVEAMAGFADEAFVDDAGNAVGLWGRGDLTVTVLGHIDTVPGDIPVRREDGVLHGRGAVDAKGSFCAAVAAVAGLPASLKDHLRVRLIGAVEEESASSKGARFAVRAYEAPDLVIIGEPSGWDAYTLGYKGRLLARLTAERPNVHSSRDEPSAAELAVTAFAAVRTFVQEDNRGVDRRFDALQLSLRSLDSDNDGLVQRCDAVLGLRLPPRWPAAALSERLRALALPHGVRLSLSGQEEAYRGPKDSVLARAFRVAIRGTGARPRSVVKTGTSDMNVVAPHWAVPMVAYGPGDAALDHTPDERLELAEYLRAVEVLRAVFGRLADGRRATSAQ